MQSLQHPFVHRGANTTRTNTRWHPYTCSRSLLSGAPSTASPTSSAHLSAFDSVQDGTPKPMTVGGAPSKATHVMALIDQFVKTASDMWRPESIPTVFAMSTHIIINAASTFSQSSPSSMYAPTHTRGAPLQLLSPCSPSTQTSSPFPHFGRPHGGGPDPGSISSGGGIHIPNGAFISQRGLVPMKTFVCEVLKRSRTTLSVLRLALCYIEAVRQKVSDLIELEKLGRGMRGDLDISERIVQGGEEDDQRLHSEHDCLRTGRRNDQVRAGLLSRDLTAPIGRVAQTFITKATDNQRTEQTQRNEPSELLEPLPPLPSPLLCPRRTFLAALILASKFQQDRCYSNRTWATLSGITPREVGRCERALGEALEWRLWVNKVASTEETSLPDSRCYNQTILDPRFRGMSQVSISPISNSAWKKPPTTIRKSSSTGGHNVSKYGSESLTVGVSR